MITPWCIAAGTLPCNCMKKILLLLLSAAFVAGCAMTGQLGSSKQPAVTCTHCQAVWVAAPVAGGKPGAVMLYSGKHRRACTYCQKMAANYLATGKLEGKCPRCGLSMRQCTVEVIQPPKEKSS